MIINKMIASVLPYMPKKLVWAFSKRYIAGVHIEDAIRVAKKLNIQGIKITIDLLGEFISDLGQAEKNKLEYLNIINRVEKENIDGNYSLKPTMFGLLLDKKVCYEKIQCTDLEIELFRKLKKEFPGNVGLVFQAYLKRTLNDIKDLQDLNSDELPINYRLCKGIYIEPEEIAYKKKDEINQHFLEDIDYIFRNKIYTGIATHDKTVINGAYEMIAKYKIPKDKYEFQMLYGVTPELRRSVLEKGHIMRVYVPFGKDWFAYSTRRLKENPQMTNHIIKALFIRG